MSVKEQMTLAAAAAVALATGALWPVFAGQDWFWRTIGAVLMVMISGLVTRRLGLPRPLQPLVALLVLSGYVIVVFAGSTLDSGLIPNGRTLDLLQSLANHGQSDINDYGPPVPASTGLVLLTTAGVGAVALVVDLIAVVLDRAAVAGLPLLALFAVPAAVLPGGLGNLPFVLGATGWMGMLLVEGSDRVLRWGTPMRSARPGARAGGDDSSLGRVGRRIGVAAVGAALVVPLLIPGLDAGLIGGNGHGPGAGSGGANSKKTYNPITSLGNQLNLPRPVELFQYVTTDPQPDYIRMTTLNKWTGDGWDTTDLSASQRDAKVQNGIRSPIGDGGPHRSFTMSIKIKDDHLSVYWLPVPFGPTQIDVEGLWLWEAKSQTVFSAQRNTENLPRYDVKASRVLPDRDGLALAEFGGIPQEIGKAYGGDIKLAPSVRALTHRITDKEVSEYDKAVALQAYFANPRNGFTYNLVPSQPRSGQDHLEAFLAGKQGFCEQYASAMAAMLRAAGIPSRVAVGFTPGQKLEGSDVYSVTTNQAHAWPEAWFAGTGWVRFEPTPSTQSGAFAPGYSVGQATTPGTDPQTTPTAAPTATGGPLRNKNIEPDLLNPAKAPAAIAAANARSHRASYVALGAVTIGLLLVSPLLLTFIRRRRRWLAPTPLTAWDQLRDDASDVGFRWHDADSPRTAAEQLRKWRPLPSPAVEALATLALAAERARYAPPERQVALNLRPQVALLRAALQDVSPLPARLRARFLTPSTLRWVVEGVGDAMAAVTNRIDDSISALTRPLRRRAAATR